MIEGAWEIQGDGILGWARDNDKDRPIWVELIAGSDIIGIALASLPSPENCGFWLPLSSALAEEEIQLHIRVANSDIYLKETEPAAAEKAVSSPAPLVGEIFVDRGLSFSGWALDSANTDLKLKIDAWIDDKCVASTIAAENRYRPPQAREHGFTLSLPDIYADGERHIVHIRDHKGRDLPGSPLQVCSLPAHAGKWLEQQKKPEKPALNLLKGLLEHMEERLPGFTSQSNYDSWKKAFPAASPAMRQKLSINTQRPDLLKNQQFCEISRRDNSEFILLPGNAKNLHPFFLSQMAEKLKETDGLAIYSDGEDENQRPLFKPAWDKEAFFAQDYLGPILVKRAAFIKAGITSADPEPVARIKLLLSAPENKIRHLPMTLYQAARPENMATREEAIRQWLDDHLPGSSLINGRIRHGLSHKPRISILIPTKDRAELLKTCLDSLETTAWPDYEIIIIDNGSTQEEALALLKEAEKKQNICVLRLPGIFNYAYLNNEASKQATGSLLCFLNNDTQALHPEWLEELAAILLSAGEQAGAAGAKLVWPNGLVQHGGVIIGSHQLAAHVGNQWLENEPGYMSRNLISQQYSAVTAACMLTPRDLFLENGGFDATRYAVTFNDADYCLRLRQKGKKIFWTPHSRLAHHESASRGKDETRSAKARAEREMQYFRTTWGHLDDPFYNPNLPLSANTEPFQGLAFPPRARHPR